MMTPRSGPAERHGLMLGASTNTCLTAGFTLLGAGVVGVLAGLNAHSGLSVLTSLVVIVATLVLLRAIRYADDSVGTPEQQSPPNRDKGGSRSGFAIERVVWAGEAAWKASGGLLARLGSGATAAVTSARSTLLGIWETIVSVVRGVLKALLCITTGATVGVVAAGVFALVDPELWSYAALRNDPPLGQVLLCIGSALLTAQFLLFLTFRRKRNAEL